MLGTGAHSTILHIRRNEDNKSYALKVVPIEKPEDRKFLEQAQHEHRVAQMLMHPNLIKVYALEKQRDWFFRLRKVHLLIEYVDGTTIDQVPRLTMPRLVQAFVKIGEGLLHMHRRGVVHADLKPINILMSKRGEIKIIDYGLAWIKGEAKDRVQGTPEYMAPEQSRKSTANEKTDIYNFGATMYRLVTWKLPPSTLPKPGSASMSSELFQGLLKPVKDLNPQAPPDLCDLIHRCLSYHARGRPERMSDVVDILKDLEAKLVRSDSDRLAALGEDSTLEE
jgi:serine/threonine protein kinase